MGRAAQTERYRPAPSRLSAPLVPRSHGHGSCVEATCGLTWGNRVGPVGLEPTTNGLIDGCSQLGPLVPPRCGNGAANVVWMGCIGVGRGCLVTVKCPCRASRRRSARSGAG